MEKIRVENLTKIFNGHVKQVRELLAAGESKQEILSRTGATVGVNNANFSVEDGEIFVIMGLSGSGKSTLIRMINRLIEPTSGSVYLDGKDIAKLNKTELRQVRRQQLSMVFQNFALFPQRTVLDNASYGLEIQGVGVSERHEKAMKALNRVGLKGYEEQYPSQLSGGMQQRVGLARALANDADVLLMDEAFSALDPLNRKDMQDELLELQEELHKTIIFISHDLNEALRIGNHIMIMRDGDIIQTGTPEDILTEPADDYVERFIEDVDRSKVITAGSVMIRPYTVNIDRDGPRVALRRMQHNEVSTLMVVDNQRQLIGLIDARDTIALIQNDKEHKVQRLDSIVQKNVATTTANTSLNKLMEQFAQTSMPVAVLDDDKRLKGIVIRGAVLAAMAGTEAE
ncbi:glycine betaine/L-proline ABC transporter ATP-binding protein [Lacticaseibacillus pabuli]|uniref:Quaternary amine transport ATP-binding protein n=1 Tax=Lacticaseibacillus pabuli TaxID=3025672 RepID=A0ABY7WV52_9LACO|nr:glycine betaine/L-proline ABC transporter ATP-binding protein [Lacticaseibacillus sp. KACC 23028]WDF83333.1 glycine betaine/L-proline ABC transporter ATP-binding protein [Lacticaseibacillus sp. KACC 23028]